MKLLLQFNLIFLFLIAINAITIKTPLGRVIGYHKKSAEGRRFGAFESIPYALPPLGKLRFQPPVPVPPWTEDLNARGLPEACAQFDYLTREVKGQEDCLYLNVYTPAINKAVAMPVIFWINGGGFQYGTCEEYGPKYLMDKNLILVTFNYRVGPFGFLSTGDEVVSGNMGLKDQSLALQWVSKNIQYFGGDPKRITLGGVSAGGASVHYHYLSPMSAGLFQNGISFSGTALDRWAFLPNSSNTTKMFAKASGCPTHDSTEMVNCLREVPASNITAKIKELSADIYFSYVLFPPVAEKKNKHYFINDSPKNLLKYGWTNDVPWITGVVSEEGLYITAGFALNKTMEEYTEKHWETVAPYMLHLQRTIPESEHARIVNLAKKHYLGDKHFSTDRTTVRQLTHLAGDSQIAIDAIRAAKLQAQVHKSPVWFYYYSYRAAQSASDDLSHTTEDLGVSHDDDIYMVLENSFIDPTTRESDKAMQQVLLRFWYSFASIREPIVGVNWPRVNHTAKKFQFMHMAGPGNFSMESNNNLAEISFWKQIGL